MGLSLAKGPKQVKVLALFRATEKALRLAAESEEEAQEG